LFISDDVGGYREFEFASNQETDKFGIKNAKKFVVSCDKKTLITSGHGENSELRKYCIETKKIIKIWKSEVDEVIFS